MRKEIFISYSSKNGSAVKGLANDIVGLGQNVWYDIELTGGQNWWGEILFAIRKCDVFVLALSPEYLASKACQSELEYANQLNKPILPVLISGSVSTNLLPRSINSRQIISYRINSDKNAALDLSKAINNLPFFSTLPNPLPAEPPIPLEAITDIWERVSSETIDLNRKDQQQLLTQLKELKNSAKQKDVIQLLKRFRQRQDILASVLVEVDELLLEIEEEVTITPTQRELQSPTQFGFIENPEPKTTKPPTKRKNYLIPFISIVLLLLLGGIILGLIYLWQNAHLATLAIEVPTVTISATSQIQNTTIPPSPIATQVIEIGTRLITIADTGIALYAAGDYVEDVPLGSYVTVALDGEGEFESSNYYHVSFFIESVGYVTGWIPKVDVAVANPP